MAFTEDDPVEGQIKFNVNRHPASRALHIHSKWENKETFLDLYFMIERKQVKGRVNDDKKNVQLLLVIDTALRNLLLFSLFEPLLLLTRDNHSLFFII